MLRKQPKQKIKIRKVSIVCETCVSVMRVCACLYVRVGVKEANIFLIVSGLR